MNIRREREIETVSIRLAGVGVRVVCPHSHRIQGTRTKELAVFLYATSI